MDMRKSIGTAGLLLMGLLIGMPGAQKPGQGGASMGKGMGANMGMKGHRMMMSDSCPMGGMMMHGMFERTMVPTSDGGVVVMVGNQLYKFDKNLALKKEAAIKVDTAKIREAMREAMQACPMMEMSRDTSTVRPGGPTGKAAPEAAPGKPAKKTADKTARQEKQEKAGDHPAHH